LRNGVLHHTEFWPTVPGMRAFPQPGARKAGPDRLEPGKPGAMPPGTRRRTLRRAFTATVFAAIAVAALPAPAETSLPQAPADPRYTDCLAAIARSPKEAFDIAASWRFSGGGLPASHCATLAMVAMGQYDYAARQLETLAIKLGRDDARNVAAVLGQAGNAWLLAGEPKRALDAFTDALAATPDDPDILVDRAMAHATTGDLGSAIADLDAAIATDPTNVAALVFRASARRRSGDLTAAASDVAQALAISPRDAQALFERGLQREAAGDVAGARLDWEQVIALVPGTTEADAARVRINALPPPR
jgi:tetratricopeptide (TPR) repeat protein